MNATVIRDNLIYSLNMDNKSASVIGEEKKGSKKDIIIPRSIIYEEKEFIITNISQKSFYERRDLRSVHFPSDSEILIFEESAFDSSSIEEIKIPPSLTTIGKFAFVNCSNLKTIEIPINSNLQEIKCGAFCWCTKIEQIYFPPKIKEISYRCFDNCSKLKNIIIPKNSELQSIGSFAFDSSPIECITIPTSFVKLLDAWCIRTPKITQINVFSDNPLFSPYKGEFILQKSSIDKRNFNILAFCIRNIQTIKIPNFIETIGNFAFSLCNQAFSIEFEKNSQLNKIEEYSFNNCSFTNIEFPPNLTYIAHNSFFNCANLRTIMFPSNSKLKQIDDDVFSKTSLTCLYVPPELVEIHKFAFDCKLLIIEFDENSKLNSIHAQLFSSCEIFMVPIKLSKIVVT